MSDRTIVEVLAMLVPAPVHTVPVPDIVHVPDPIRVVDAAADENTPVVTLYVTASNVPAVRVRVRAEFSDRASASWTVPEGWLTVTGHPN